MTRIPIIDASNFSSQSCNYIVRVIPPPHSSRSSVKISRRIKALIVMAVVVYVLAHLIRAILSTMLRSNALLHPLRRSPASPRRTTRLESDEAETLKHRTRC